MQKNLSEGSILKTLLLFAAPMIAGNLLQQVYNITDTLIVGRCIGTDALAAVGSAYTLMTFLTSVIIGLCMGGGAVCSLQFGAQRLDTMRESIWVAFWLILLAVAAIQAAVLLCIDPILALLQVPGPVYPLMRAYTRIIFWGLGAVFLYNFCAYMLRAVGNSAAPLYFLAGSSALNIALDLWFVLGLDWGVQGAAWATVLAQVLAGAGIAAYTLLKMPLLRPARQHRRIRRAAVSQLLRYSLLTCVQQSVMNFGILLIQGLVNSFGSVVMAAFAAAVKIDTLAYMPAQEFGNAFSLFVSQNHGAGRDDRVRRGFAQAARLSIGFCVLISALVWALAGPLMQLFVDRGEAAVIAAGVTYLRIEGAFYWGIGCLFLFYGLYRGMEKPGLSLLLTVLSLGTRVALAYALAPATPLGVLAIWWAIPIGWLLADAVGLGLYRRLFTAKAKPQT